MPYSAQTMFDIVNDVSAYPDFLPWCADVKIASQSQHAMQASILMKKGALHHWFTTQNTIVENKSIHIKLVDGPFKSLQGSWTFIALDQESCKITLDLNFEFSQSLVSKLVAPVFTQIANTMVDSFCSRAHDRHQT